MNTLILKKIDINENKIRYLFKDCNIYGSQYRLDFLISDYY